VNLKISVADLILPKEYSNENLTISIYCGRKNIATLEEPDGT